MTIEELVDKLRIRILEHNQEIITEELRNEYIYELLELIKIENYKIEIRSLRPRFHFRHKTLCSSSTISGVDRMNQPFATFEKIGLSWIWRSLLDCVFPRSVEVIRYNEMMDFQLFERKTLTIYI